VNVSLVKGLEGGAYSGALEAQKSGAAGARDKATPFL
jgi:hypothetical protein